MCVLAIPVILPVYLFVVSVVAFEKSGRYVETATITAAAIAVLKLIHDRSRPPIEVSSSDGQQAAAVDRVAALEGTYSYASSRTSERCGAHGSGRQCCAIVVGAITGATGVAPVQYGILGALFGTGVQLIAFHNIVEAAVAAGQGRARRRHRNRRFAAALSAQFRGAVERVHGRGRVPFAVMGATLAAVIERASEVPVLAVVIGGA